MKPLIIVDGYNIIGAQKRNFSMMQDLETCRDHLCSDLEDYAGFTDSEIMLVFDGYQSENVLRSEDKHGNLTVIYTKHGETADSYIERVAATIPKYREIYVATSDNLEQSQIFSTGAIRMTAAELIRLLDITRHKEINEHIRNSYRLQKNSMMQRLPEEIRRKLEEMRLSNE